MKNEKSSDELAVKLRIRLAREVAVLANQLNILVQQASGLRSEISDFDNDKDRKAFLQALLTECADHLEKGTLASTAGEIEEKYKQYIVNAGLEDEKAKDELEKLQSGIAVLEAAVEKVLAQIKEDVSVEKYGRGELILTSKGLQRIIGRIAYLNETTDPAFGIILGESNKTKATISEIVWMCENSKQNPPLFFVDINLMLPDEKELSDICWKTDDYQLLVKNIPKCLIVWQVGSMFSLNKSAMREVYLMGRSDGCVDVIRIEKSTYPHWKVEILGRAVRNKENLKALCSWGGYNEAPIDLEAVSRDYNSSLNMMEWYIFKKYPGVILEMPQWEGERLPIS